MTGYLNVSKYCIYRSDNGSKYLVLLQMFIITFKNETHIIYPMDIKTAIQNNVTHFKVQRKT